MPSKRLFQTETDKMDESFEDDTDLVNVDGTKVKLSGKVLKVSGQRPVFNDMCSPLGVNFDPDGEHTLLF
jgi:hypothetical protein